MFALYFHILCSSTHFVQTKKINELKNNKNYKTYMEYGLNFKLNMWIYMCTYRKTITKTIMYTYNQKYVYRT